MELKFRCAQCESVVAAPVTVAGSTIACPSCETKVTVPGPTASVGMKVGNFQLEEEVPSSAVGRLFIATQLSMDRHVVVKIFEPSMFAERDFSDALLEHLQILGKIEHAGINRYLDSGNFQGLLYIAMSFVEGTSLATHLDESDPLDETEAIDVVREIATNLMEVYERHGEIHGDLKPANIMITPDGEVRLLNFGLMLGTGLGPPENPEAGHAMVYYASPERLKRMEADWRADLYSLGVILFHMLTGGVPYAGDTSIEIAAEHLNEAVPAVRDYDKSLSLHTSKVVKKMMATNPDERQASWREAIEDLEALLQGERPPSVVMKRKRPESAAKASRKVTVAKRTPVAKAVVHKSKMRVREQVLPPKRQTPPAVLALAVLALFVLIAFTIWFLFSYTQSSLPQP